jgi:uncharacterized SAM-binding protein YcdF (DUF218 family)
MAAFVNLLKGLLLPPFAFVLTALAGFALWRRRPRTARALIGASLALLWASSTPALDHLLRGWVEYAVPFEEKDAAGAEAIVILSGGLARRAPEFGGADTLNAGTLNRLRYGAILARKTGLPVLVSGGVAPGADTDTIEAEVLKAVLEKEFGVPARWTEPRSRDTFENALETAKLLRAEGISRIVLVTEAFHMRRSLQAFELTGMVVVPAPMNIGSGETITPRDFLPSPWGFGRTYLASHELIGRLWYAIRAVWQAG